MHLIWALALITCLATTVRGHGVMTSPIPRRSNWWDYPEYNTKPWLQRVRNGDDVTDKECGSDAKADSIAEHSQLAVGPVTLSYQINAPHEGTFRYDISKDDGKTWEILVPTQQVRKDVGKASVEAALESKHAGEAIIRWVWDAYHTPEQYINCADVTIGDGASGSSGGGVSSTGSSTTVTSTTVAGPAASPAASAANPSASPVTKPAGDAASHSVTASATPPYTTTTADSKTPDDPLSGNAPPDKRTSGSRNGSKRTRGSKRHGTKTKDPRLCSTTSSVAPTATTSPGSSAAPPASPSSAGGASSGTGQCPSNGKFECSSDGNSFRICQFETDAGTANQLMWTKMQPCEVPGSCKESQQPCGTRAAMLRRELRV
ncbi:hypothetical protein CXG81DRAFT_28447 [Caulochytrium protostelioides]|uniref:Chitin-binding type-4 domain-containing protein n=1 Tax=Caulochytrium protostelioides TaxID=1555241 RepID=A0A4P9X1G8_9FUNG|nr:hypothetical protein CAUPRSCDRAFT_11186 [Caulochytrium protostelioides]RKO98753.1 hypothetical protein CXG81DRAFT_28447 [Caulochytrium protostelioides]|eukprot:RKO98753.1 hypothetical protein CXG81DRAFT_28447 [Caulochytrium protostelioides]